MFQAAGSIGLSQEEGRWRGEVGRALGLARADCGACAINRAQGLKPSTIIGPPHRQTNFNILKLILSYEAWGNKTKEMYYSSSMQRPCSAIKTFLKRWVFLMQFLDISNANSMPHIFCLFGKVSPQFDAPHFLSFWEGKSSFGCPLRL